MKPGTRSPLPSRRAARAERERAPRTAAVVRTHVTLARLALDRTLAYLRRPRQLPSPSHAPGR